VKKTKLPTTDRLLESQAHILQQHSRDILELTQAVADLAAMMGNIIDVFGMLTKIQNDRATVRAVVAARANKN